MNIDNLKDKKSIQEVLRRGVSQDFWLLIVQAIDRSIAHIQKEMDGDDLRDLPADQYKLENELLKAKKSYLEILKETPETLIDYLDAPEEEGERDFDPYSKPKEFETKL